MIFNVRAYALVVLLSLWFAIRWKMKFPRIYIFSAVVVYHLRQSSSLLQKSVELDSKLIAMHPAQSRFGVALVAPILFHSQVKSSHKSVCFAVCTHDTRHSLTLIQSNRSGHIRYTRTGRYILLATTHCLQFLLFAHHLRHYEFVFASNDSLSFGFVGCIAFRMVKKREVKGKTNTTTRRRSEKNKLKSHKLIIVRFWVRWTSSFMYIGSRALVRMWTM